MKVVENIKTHVLCTITFFQKDERKISCFCEESDHISSVVQLVEQSLIPTELPWPSSALRRGFLISFYYHDMIITASFSKSTLFAESSDIFV